MHQWYCLVIVLGYQKGVDTLVVIVGEMCELINFCCGVGGWNVREEEGKRERGKKERREKF